MKKLAGKEVIQKSTLMDKEKKKGKRGGIIRGVLFSIFLMITGCSMFFSHRGKTDYLSGFKGGEKGETLTPERFEGEIARAYESAAEIPDILDSLPCYCGCMLKFKHKSLLTCFTDDHAAKCKICQEEAIRAYELYKEGRDVKTIRMMIGLEFSKKEIR